MTECQALEIREALAAFALDVLEPATAATVRTHLVGCATCREELALLQMARATAAAFTPAVDAARVVAALPAPPRGQAVPASVIHTRVVRTRSWWTSRPVLAAAASLVLMLGVALPAAREAIRGGERAPVADTALASAGSLESPNAGAVAVPVEGGLESLSDDDLTALLGVLEGLEATPVAEPVTIGASIVDTPEVP